MKKEVRIIIKKPVDVPHAVARREGYVRLHRRMRFISRKICPRVYLGFSKYGAVVGLIVIKLRLFRSRVKLPCGIPYLLGHIWATTDNFGKSGILSV